MLKTQDNFKIMELSGASYDMHDDFNILVQSLSIPSPTPKIVTDESDDMNGLIRLQKRWKEKEITAVCSLSVDGYSDVEDVISKLYNVLMLNDSFFLIRDSQSHKRWLVEVSNKWKPNKTGTFIEFEIPLISYSPYAESINLVEYKHSANFSFNNIGDVPIDMREQTETEVVFQGASEKLIIRNNTTGDEWKHNGTTAADDVILLKGVRSTMNSHSIFRDTNKKLLTFAPGWNGIEIEGSTDYTITIRTRFYYI